MDIVQEDGRVCVCVHGVVRGCFRKLLCVKAVARWQRVKSGSRPLLFIRVAFAGRLFTQFDSMHKLEFLYYLKSF